MTQIFKIPMTKDFLNELEDAYVDQKTSLHRFIFELITGLCREAKLCKLSKNTPVNRWVDKKRTQKVVKFKEIRLEDFTLPSNPNWCPEDMDIDDMTTFDLKLREKTMEYLNLYGQIISIRVKNYNESTDKHEAEILDDLRKNGTNEEGLKVQEEQNRSAKELRDYSFPTCLEQAIFGQIYQPIHQAVSKNVEQVFNKEFEESYGEEEKEREKEIKKRVESKQKDPPPTR